MVKEIVKGTDGKPLTCKREHGYLYFVGADGVVNRAKMERRPSLTDAEIKKREKAAEEKTANFQARVAANAAKRLQKNKETAARVQERKDKRKAKLKAQLAAVS